MATYLRQKADRPPTSSSMAYAPAPEPLLVPRTPLESRQGYHPKTVSVQHQPLPLSAKNSNSQNNEPQRDDRLKWNSPPSRQLSRQKRVEYESDVRERFYDDYLGERTSGDARNEVLTTSELAKMKFDPSHYRANAFQGLAYDPMRPVPAGLDFNVALQQEKVKERQRQAQSHRQRRLSDSAIGSNPANYYQNQYPPTEAAPQQNYTASRGPATLPPLERPRSALQQSMDEVVSHDMVPAVESWLLNANKKDQEVAADFFRTLSSHGKRPDPAAKAALHHTRVRSAVMTPSRKQRQDQQISQNTFQQLSRDTTMMDKHSKPTRKSEPSKRHRLQRSNSEKSATKGSMFAANKQLPSHFTVHPEWGSESRRT